MTPKIPETAENLTHYVFRTIATVEIVAARLNAADVHEMMRQARTAMAAKVGAGSAEEHRKRLAKLKGKTPTA